MPGWSCGCAAFFWLSDGRILIETCVGNGVNLRQLEADGLLCFFGGVCPGLPFGFSLGPQCFSFAEKDFAEAGWASLLLDLFRIRALLRWADEGAVFVLVDLAHGLYGGCFFRGHEAPVAVVL